MLILIAERLPGYQYDALSYKFFLQNLCGFLQFWKGFSSYDDFGKN
jgi:hypothetical protein